MTTMREEAVSLVGKLNEYKKLMAEAQKIKDELYKGGWVIHYRKDGECEMFNMGAMQKELDKQKEM